MAIMTYAKFHFNRLMLTFIFDTWAPSRAWQTTEKAGPDRVNASIGVQSVFNHVHCFTLMDICVLKLYLQTDTTDQ